MKIEVAELRKPQLLIRKFNILDFDTVSAFHFHHFNLTTNRSFFFFSFFLTIGISA